MKQYEVVTCYDVEPDHSLTKTGYAVVAKDGIIPLETVYKSNWWILCFLRANRLTKEQA